jgi:hypothetical protein
MYKREVGGMIIEAGISSSTMAIRGSSIPLSRWTREVEGAWERGEAFFSW